MYKMLGYKMLGAAMILAAGTFAAFAQGRAANSKRKYRDPVPSDVVKDPPPPASCAQPSISAMGVLVAGTAPGPARRHRGPVARARPTHRPAARIRDLRGRRQGFRGAQDCVLGTSLLCDRAGARADVDFTAPYVLIEGTYMVLKDSPSRWWPTSIAPACDRGRGGLRLRPLPHAHLKTRPWCGRRPAADAP